ncbi:hypothetical protein F4775DRAFT_591413 [Biscogniauxia sp. FL1348]|nr:hypothetical protein F4775DRAFT_591413 [Biscogniauxia sp. FL1348]
MPLRRRTKSQIRWERCGGQGLGLRPATAAGVVAAQAPGSRDRGRQPPSNREENATAACTGTRPMPFDPARRALSNGIGCAVVHPEAGGVPLWGATIVALFLGRQAAAEGEKLAPAAACRPRNSATIGLSGGPGTPSRGVQGPGCAGRRLITVLPWDTKESATVQRAAIPQQSAWRAGFILHRPIPRRSGTPPASGCTTAHPIPFDSARRAGSNGMGRVPVQAAVAFSSRFEGPEGSYPGEELPWRGATLEELPWRSYPGGATLEKLPWSLSGDHAGGGSGTQP